ncbi:hypothetical protein [Granulicella mallensis]|uniref:Uncharacterized protein n=1 Tax=Granulicella mallensis TaxID=940614 RepID=A0A7W8E9A0_9BACT|nr:hypothetical protein [Granulicella mallensis]MBB5063557.1 hypothetical protein [Granulicella mallensis]
MPWMMDVLTSSERTSSAPNTNTGYYRRPPKLGAVDQFAISALLLFESLLRDAIAQRRDGDASAYGFAILIEPIQDLAWALMRPVPGSSLRVLHFMQTQPFRVPPGLIPRSSPRIGSLRDQLACADASWQ